MLDEVTGELECEEADANRHATPGTGIFPALSPTDERPATAPLRVGRSLLVTNQSESNNLKNRYITSAATMANELLLDSSSARGTSECRDVSPSALAVLSSGACQFFPTASVAGGQTVALAARYFPSARSAYVLCCLQRSSIVSSVKNVLVFS